MHHRNIAYLIADSVGGRIVVWDRSADAYRTVQTIHDGPDPAQSRRTPSPERERGSEPRRGLDDHDAIRKKVRAAFAAVLAEHVRQFAAAHALEGFIIAAPSRMLGPLLADLKNGPPILGSLAKDLTGIADHDLGHWLIKAELHSES
jgi:hypothetical protein